MRSGKRILLAASLPALLGTASLCLAVEPVRVGLLVSAPTTPASVLQAFRAETDRVLRAPEWAILWRDLESNDGRESYDRLVVIRLTGSCSPLGGRQVWKGPLGFTHVSDGRVLPFVDVDCGRVQQVLSGMAAESPRVLLMQEFGRALGRVVAHELYHVLSERRDHDTEGLAKPFLTQSELVDGDIAFAEETRARIRHALLPPAHTNSAALLSGAK
jgi:hypothetical protein